MYIPGLLATLRFSPAESHKPGSASCKHQLESIILLCPWRARGSDITLFMKCCKADLGRSQQRKENPVSMIPYCPPSYHFPPLHRVNTCFLSCHGGFAFTHTLQAAEIMTATASRGSVPKPGAVEQSKVTCPPCGMKLSSGGQSTGLQTAKLTGQAPNASDSN